MAEIIPIKDLLQARQRQREQDSLQACITAIEHSLAVQLKAFANAPIEEMPVRARKIRQLGDLLEYATNLL